jgi:hypothetical protein
VERPEIDPEVLSHGRMDRLVVATRFFVGRRTVMLILLFIVMQFIPTTRQDLRQQQQPNRSKRLKEAAQMPHTCVP